ncbi:MAG TPA: ABC transporter ATP-binding protein [Candidatus Latescibacteria bacterium]|nr:ABC transporter ATP-binding protein [Candidatus Latescibacterota bacterium]
MEYTIYAEGLTKRFGNLTAVDDVSLKVERGALFGFIGPNGAGKTTTINMLTGLLTPTSGTVEILGLDLKRDSVEIKRNMGVMPESSALYEQLTGEEYLYFVGRMYGLEKEEIHSRCEELFEFMELQDYRKTYIYEYSMGMKKKLSLASIFIHDPRVLFLDEPFEGIDPVSSKLIRGALEQMRDKGATIFLTSHILSTVEKMCTEICIINKGKIIFTSPTEEIRDRIKNELNQSKCTDLEGVFLSLVAPEQEGKGLSWLRK